MTEVTIQELIALLKKPGKAYICMSNSEAILSIDKSDFLFFLKQENATANKDVKPYKVHKSDYGLHIERNV
jgi:hypothetical protein